MGEHDAEPKNEHAQRPPTPSPAAGPDAVLQLQQSAGNAAVAQLLGPAQQAPVGIPPARQAFINQCVGAIAWLLQQQAAATSVASRATAAYDDAHKMYTEATKSQADTDKLVDDLAFDAALSFLPNGRGIKGVMMAAMGGEGGNLIISGAKEIAAVNTDKFVKQGVSGELVQKFGIPMSMPPVAKSPIQFQAEIMARLNDVLSRIYGSVNCWLVAANDPASPADFNFNPSEVVMRSFTIEGVAVGGIEPPATSALLLEKGIWEKHLKTKTLIPEEHFRENSSGERDEHLGPGAGVHTGGFKVGMKIRRRIKACASGLGEDGEVWIRDWGEQMRQTWSRGTYPGETERWHGDAWF